MHGSRGDVGRRVHFSFASGAEPPVPQAGAPPGAAGSTDVADG